MTIPLLPPVLKFWNLIFFSYFSVLFRPPPYLPPPHPMISVSPVNQAKSAQGRDCGEKHLCVLADDNFLMPLLQKQPFFRVKRRAAKICVSIMGSRKEGHLS